MKADGAIVTLTAEQVMWRGRSGKSFAIKEWFEKLPKRPRLVVVSTRPLPVDKYWTADVTGVLGTLSGVDRDGGTITQRVIIVSPENVTVYCDPKGRPFLFIPIKGFERNWENKMSLVALSRTSTTTSSMSTMSSGDLPAMPDSPNSAPDPIFCATIAEAEAQYSSSTRVLVELDCKPVQSPATGQFVLAEDDSSNTIPVYCTKPVLATDRVTRLVGTIQKDASNNYWIEVDSGPNWNLQYPAGSMQVVHSGTIVWAKTFPDWMDLPTDGRAHALENKPVTWLDPNGVMVYIEEEDRSAGMLVYAGTVPFGPHVVNVDGYVSGSDIGERMISGSLTYTDGGPTVRPVGMSHKNIGGFNLSAYNPQSNIGMLLKIWGKVTAVDTDSGCFYLNDGSGLQDGTTNSTTSQSNVGVRVLYNDSILPSVNDYVVVTGPCAKAMDPVSYNYVTCIKTVGSSDVMFYPPRAAPGNLSATPCNAAVVLGWDPVNAEGYRVYRSTSQTTGYQPIANISTTAYTDNAVTNGTTYWYKVAATGSSVAGPLTDPVSATPSSSAPVVSIVTSALGSDGLLTLQCTGTYPAGAEPLYALWVDGCTAWTFLQSEISQITYDTTQLANGTHTFVVWSTVPTTSGLLCGLDTRSINVQNRISQFNMPDDMCGLQPISAVFSSPSNWTLTCQQGSNVLYTSNGTGTSMNVAWDAGSASGDFDVTLAAVPASGGTEQTKTVKASKVQGGNPPRPWVWSSVYDASSDSTDQGSLEYAHNAATGCLFAKLGVTVVPIGIIDQDSDWQNLVMSSILDAPSMPADIFVFNGHGIVGGTDPKNLLSQSGISLRPTVSAYSQGSGLVPFFSLTSRMRGTGVYEPIGPPLGNTITWDHTTGRFSNWVANRRLKFVYIGACQAGKSVMCMAFGIPRGRYPGKGRAFLGFTTSISAGDLMAFSEVFWREWKKTGVTMEQAAARAFLAIKRRAGYELDGDPNLKLW